MGPIGRTELAELPRRPKLDHGRFRRPFAGCSTERAKRPGRTEETHVLSRTSSPYPALVGGATRIPAGGANSTKLAPFGFGSTSGSAGRLNEMEGRSRFTRPCRKTISVAGRPADPRLLIAPILVAANTWATSNVSPSVGRRIGPHRCENTAISLARLSTKMALIPSSRKSCSRPGPVSWTENIKES